MSRKPPERQQNEQNVDIYRSNVAYSQVGVAGGNLLQVSIYISIDFF
jgi:hypothetical protein